MRTEAETIKTKAQSILHNISTLIPPWNVKRSSETTALGRAAKIARVSGVPGHH